MHLKSAKLSWFKIIQNKTFTRFFELIHNQRNCATADFVSAMAITIKCASLTHIYDSKNCSTVLHNSKQMPVEEVVHLFFPLENLHRKDDPIIPNYKVTYDYLTIVEKHYGAEAVSVVAERIL